ncbi:MAG: hypothetical protein WCD25_28340, partial [Pseudolabrys sp.]
MRQQDFVAQVGTTIVLALGLSLLALPTSLNAQKAAGIKRVGWLEVCAPGPKRPHFEIFRAHLAELGYAEGEEPHHRATICRLPIRPDGGVGHRP